jgi:murein DD-endopeptidase
MLLLGGLARAAELAAQGAALPEALELRVPKPPTVAQAEGGAVLAFELHVTNFARRTVSLKKVEILAGEAERGVLLTLSDSALAQAIARPALQLPAAERATLTSGLRAVVHLWVSLDGRTPPAALQGRVTVESGSGDSLRTRIVESPVVPVLPEASAIRPPLRGGLWFTGNGPMAESGHRRALIIIGSATIAQRFAIDYVKVGDDNRTFTGDSLKNESYHAYGSEALAVADGIVAAVKDSIPENVPGLNSRAVPITLETVGGNHVILDIGQGRYAFYAHLQPASLRVKLGERVTRGQVVGLVGNSGNSTEPHLHFHLSDAPSPLGSEGIPYRYDAFVLIARCTGFGAGCARGPGETRKGELPLGNRLVRFPE